MVYDMKVKVNFLWSSANNFGENAQGFFAAEIAGIFSP